MTTLLAVAGGTVFLGAVVAGLLYLPVRRSVRRSQVETDAVIARMEAEMGKTRPLPPYDPLPIPDGPPPPVELRITFHRHPEAGAAELPKVAARLIREADRLDRAYGGDGLSYDEVGSTENADQVTFRLVPVSADWDATDRLERVARQMRMLMNQAREDLARRQADDIRRRVREELAPPVPPELVPDVDVAVADVEPSPRFVPQADPVLTN